MHDYIESARTAILCPKNSNCDEINKKVLSLLSGEEKVYGSLNSVVDDDRNAVLRFPSEYLEEL